MPGLRLATVYGFPPFRLGFCGPGNEQNLKTLRKFAAGNDSLKIQTRKILSGFEASYTYYRLIARANQITDPFNRKVVNAYWLGNNLLDQVKVADLKQLILTDFTRPGLLSPQLAQQKAAAIPSGAKPHHSFHVMLLGSVTGRVKFNLRLRDLCRVSWGRVEEIKNQKLKVSYQPLAIKYGNYFLDQPVSQSIIWERDFLPQVEIGQTISFHWGRTCQALGKRQVANLLKYTLQSLKLASGLHK